jgi:hypothetical protein
MYDHLLLLEILEILNIALNSMQFMVKNCYSFVTQLLSYHLKACKTLSHPPLVSSNALGQEWNKQYSPLLPISQHYFEQSKISLVFYSVTICIVYGLIQVPCARQTDIYLEYYTIICRYKY